MPGTVVGRHLLCLGSCLARGIGLQLFVQTYRRLLSAFWHFYNHAYSTHFVKSSGLNAKHLSLLCAEGVCTACNSYSVSGGDFCSIQQLEPIDSSDRHGPRLALMSRVG
jgi:hypothetical protein